MYDLRLREVKLNEKGLFDAEDYNNVETNNKKGLLRFGNSKENGKVKNQQQYTIIVYFSKTFN